MLNCSLYLLVKIRLFEWFSHNLDFHYCISYFGIFLEIHIWNPHAFTIVAMLGFTNSRLLVKKTKHSILEKILSLVPRFAVKYVAWEPCYSIMDPGAHKLVTSLSLLSWISARTGKMGRFHSCQSTGGQTTSFWSDKWPFLFLYIETRTPGKK